MGSADLERLANDRVEDLLDLYARERLSPAAAVLERIRAEVVGQARAAAEARSPAAALSAPFMRPARGRFAGVLAPLSLLPGLPSLPRLRRLPGLPRLPRLPRRAFALGLAGTLALGSTAAVLGAPPGSALYDARLVLEGALMVPTVLDLDARLAAYEEQFESRLAEAEDALARGDTAGASAALAAYQAEVSNAVAEVGDSADRLAHLESVLAKHIAKLQALAERLPTEQARQNALQHAIDASERAVQKLSEQRGQGSPGNGNPGNGNPGNGNPGNGIPNPNQGPGNNSGGNGNPNPAKSPGDNSGSNPGGNGGNRSPNQGPGNNSGGGPGEGPSN